MVERVREILEVMMVREMLVSSVVMVEPSRGRLKQGRMELETSNMNREPALNDTICHTQFVAN